MALRTADAGEARRCAALLSARFVIVKAGVEAMRAEERSFLTGTEIEALFRGELERELAKALADGYATASWPSSIAECAKPLAEVYRIARRPERPHVLTGQDRDQLRQRGVDDCDIQRIAEYLSDLCHDADPDAEVVDRLMAIGAPAGAELLAVARGPLLRARAEAWRRAERMFDETIADAPNPVQALLDIGDIWNEGARRVADRSCWL